MASKERKFHKSASVSSKFSGLFLRKLQENIHRKNQIPGRNIVIKKLKSTYAYEISCMMHTLGDVEWPLKTSILYLETVLRDQINLLLIQASEIADADALTHKPFLTLLANNRKKMSRLLHYLFLKDSTGKRKYDEIADVVNDTQFGARVEICLEHLRVIDAGGYDPETIKTCRDDIFLERFARKSQMSQRMSNEKYFSFQKKQCVGFYPKSDGGKFKKWLLNDNVTDLQPTAIALDILAFLARETIAEVVEASLQIRPSKKLSNLNSPTAVSNNKSPTKVNPTGTLTQSDLDVPSSPFRSSGIHGLPNFIADCTDSNAEIGALLNSGTLGIADVFALSTSPLYEKDTFSLTEGSPCSKKRKIEIMDSSTESDGEKSVMEEISGTTYGVEKSIIRSNIPMIPPRKPDDPITLEELKSAVINVIFSGSENIHTKKKKILCIE